jgi:hypothetical protein
VQQQQRAEVQKLPALVQGQVWDLARNRLQEAVLDLARNRLQEEVLDLA